MDAATEKTLRQLEEMTEGVLRTLEQVDNIAQDFSRGDGGTQQRELFSKVESLASSFEEMHELPIAPETTVPFAVLEHIDKAENPDVYVSQRRQAPPPPHTTLPVPARAPRRFVSIGDRRGCRPIAVEAGCGHDGGERAAQQRP